MAVFTSVKGYARDFFGSGVGNLSTLSVPTSSIVWPVVSVERGLRDNSVSSTSWYVVDLFEQLFMFRERTQVSRFLYDCSFLAPLLVDVYIQIATYFPYSQSYLEVDVDTEGSGMRKLLVTITTDLEPDEAFKVLQDFDDNWWLRNLERAEGCLSILLEL